MKKIEKALDLLEQYHENYWDDFYEMSEENYARKTANKNAIDNARAELAQLKGMFKGIDCAVNKKDDYTDMGKLVMVREIILRFKMLMGGE